MKEITMHVTPEEAVALAEHSFPFTFCGAVSVADSCAKAIWGLYADDPSFAHLCTNHAVFEAGRIQGIREERIRRKAHTDHESSKESYRDYQVSSIKKALDKLSDDDINYLHTMAMHALINKNQEAEA